MNMLVYIDRGATELTAVHTRCILNKLWRWTGSSTRNLYTGVIASNGVNGDKASQQGLPAYGIVVCRLLVGCHTILPRWRLAGNAYVGRVWP